MGMQDRKETTGQGRSMQDTLRQVQRTLDGRGTRGKRKVESKGRTVAARTAGLVIHTQEPEPVADESILEKVQMLTKRIGGRTTVERGIRIRHADGSRETIAERKTVQRPTTIESSRPQEVRVERVVEQVPVYIPVPVPMIGDGIENGERTYRSRVRMQRPARKLLGAIPVGREVVVTEKSEKERRDAREEGWKVKVIDEQGNEIGE